MTNLPKCGMSLQEIAQETGMSVSAVNMCIQRALRKLRHLGEDNETMLKMKELAHDLDSNRKVQHET